MKFLRIKFMNLMKIVILFLLGSLTDWKTTYYICLSATILLKWDLGINYNLS